MTRPIDADALKETIDNIWDGRPLSFLGTRILTTIDHAPTIESSKSTEQNVAAEPSGDLISRQWLLDLYEIDTTDFKETAKVPLEVVIQNIKDAPSVSLPSADRPTLKQTDTMLIADALRYLAKDTERHELDRTRAEELREQILQYGASMCHSADRPKGEWLDEDGDKVEVDDNGITECSCWCSVCGEWLVASDEYSTKGNFCPNCGADMRGEK